MKAARQRRSIRLAEFDYSSPGVYFVTICTGGRRLFFNHSLIRQRAEACWLAIPEHNPGVTLDEWVVMPNHIHGLIEIHERQRDDKVNRGGGVQLNAPTVDSDDIEGGSEPSLTVDPETIERADSTRRLAEISPRSGSLSVIVRTYKAAVTTACRKDGNGAFQWQRNYFEHVVRDLRELDAIRRYIRLNPLRWALDRDNPANKRRRPPPVTIEDYLADLGED